MENISIIYRTIIALVFLFIIVKIMGKKQVSQLNVFDYIIGITIGSIVADISLDIEKSLISGILSMIVFALFSILVSYLTMKSLTFRRFFMGVPTILIENNKIIESGLKKAKIDINDLLLEARIKGYFNLDEIESAVMEISGEISFLPKDKDKPLTKKDMNLQSKKTALVANIILDEQLLENNLKSMNKDIKWLKQILKVQGYNNYKGILLATLDDNDKVTIYPKNIKSVKKTILE